MFHLLTQSKHNWIEFWLKLRRQIYWKIKPVSYCPVFKAVLRYCYSLLCYVMYNIICTISLRWNRRTHDTFFLMIIRSLALWRWPFASMKPERFTSGQNIPTFIWRGKKEKTSGFSFLETTPWVTEKDLCDFIVLCTSLLFTKSV